MKYKNIIPVLMFFSLLLMPAGIYAQNLSALMDAISKMEKKLEKLIQKESAERKAADAQLRKGIAAKKGGGTTIVKQDTALTKAVANLKESLEKTQANQAELNKQFSALTDRLEKLQGKEEDERVKEMALDLQNLINELKTAINMKDDTAEEAEEEEEKEAMELGGLVTLDYGMDLADAAHPAMEIGEVGLSAVVNIAEGFVASIALLAEGNLSEISIDEALMEWAPEKKPFSFLVGQQAFNHGLLSTHLISDPLILDYVETINPGIIANFAFGGFLPGIAATVYHEDEETELLADSTGAVTEETVTEEAYIFGGIFNLDFEFMEESNARVSMTVHGDILDMALGTGLVLGPVALDLEAYMELMADDDAKQTGYYGGVAVGVNDNIELAVRYDGLSEDNFSDLEHRIGIGPVFNFKHGIFCALEYSYDKVIDEDGVNEIALQVGLESTIKLPGFQRKTLTRK